MQDYEKLGAFYLGRPWDPASGKSEDGLVLYDSKDLVTHAVCFGMTGSGKTGLCIAMMEEAAIDGVPVLVIDPKGDISNLLLTFPDLSAEEFLPWINEDDARIKGVAPEEYARQQAELWKKGLAAWGQDESRIRRLRDAADFAVYTPGSTAGLPVSILKSFAAPGPAIAEDPELLREQVNGTATALLGLLGMQSDPVQSREHILLATILANAWNQGRDLDLAALIQSVQSPPVSRIGVLDLESFYPAKERFALSMSLNNLLASPGFEAWLEGEPLDIAGLLHTPQGKPRVSDLFHCTPGGRGTHVLCLAAAQPDVRVDADTIRDDKSPRDALYGRDLRLLSSSGESPVEATAADAAETGSSLWPGRCPGNAEPGGPGLQGLIQRGDLVYRTTANRTRPRPRVGWAGGCVGGSDGPAENGADSFPTW